MDTHGQRIALNPWTSFQKATEKLSVEKYFLHYWFELESDWQLGEKFPTPMQFSTYPEKKNIVFLAAILTF